MAISGSDGVLGGHNTCALHILVCKGWLTAGSVSQSSTAAAVVQAN